MKKYYVYIYLNTLKKGNFIYDDLKFEHEPFYVGKGHGNRLYHHLNKVKNKNRYKNSNKFEKINEILESGLEPLIIKLNESMSEDDALDLEKSIINKIGRLDINKGPLTNLNDGGQKPQDNYHHSLETKIKISETNKSREPQDRYTLVSPEGTIHENVKLNKFCVDFGLDYQKMRKSSNKGKIQISERNISRTKETTKNCSGWEVINKKNIKSKKEKIKYILINPSGEKFIIHTNQNASKIISGLGLDFRILNLYRNKGIISIRNINQCKKKESKNCQGWEFIDPKRSEHNFESIRTESWMMTSPSGDTFKVRNLLLFCIQNGLSYRTFQTYKNKGAIKIAPNKKCNEKILNTIGWSCRKLD
jgi:hypothetical protein